MHIKAVSAIIIEDGFPDSPRYLGIHHTLSGAVLKWVPNQYFMITYKPHPTLVSPIKPLCVAHGYC